MNVVVKKIIGLVFVNLLNLDETVLRKQKQKQIVLLFTSVWFINLG